MLRILLAVCVSALLQSGAEPKAADYGAPFTLKNQQPLKQALSHPDGKLVQTSATVAEVCQKKGCWMALKSADASCRVTFKGYSFFVPKSLKGKNVLIEGSVKTKVESIADQRHYLHDAGKSKEELDKITHPKKTKTFIATSVKVLN